MSRKTIAVLFGGQSSEHEVSCVSATTIISNINQELYDIILIGITKEGKWLKVDTIESILNDSWMKSQVRAILSPDATHHGILLLEHGMIREQRIDVVFPVLHGLYGEDGTIQGLLELAKIPYVGCGVLSSSLCMDKLYTKMIAHTLGICQAKYISVLKLEQKHMSQTIETIEQALTYPMFVKPCNSGSSRGVSKVDTKEELIKGLELAAMHDHKIIVEETILGREIECAILGGSEIRASGVGEIVSAAEFYDYEAKYHSEESRTIISPQLPEGIEAKIREISVSIFKAIGGYGLARVDFFLQKDTNKIIFNEMNTIPGFTPISMYPLLWEAKGIGKAQLVEKLIQSALKRAED